MYDIIVEGFRLLSRWIGHVWEQCAWKFSRPCKDAIPLDPDDLSANISDYEKVVQCNYSHEERRAMVELIPELEDMEFLVEDVVAALSTFSLEDEMMVMLTLKITNISSWILHCKSVIGWFGTSALQLRDFLVQINNSMERDLQKVQMSIALRCIVDCCVCNGESRENFEKV